MKISALLLLICFQAMAHFAPAQITLKESSASLEKVLKTIQQQSDYDLFFSEKLVRAKGRPVVVNLFNVSVEKALVEVFKNQDQLTYSLNGKIISIKEKEASKPQQLTEGLNPRLSSPLPPPVVHGRITNEKGEAVAGVSISIKGGKTIGVTNVNGEFTLANVADNAVLVFSAVNTETFEIKLNGRTELAFSLKTKTSVLDEVQLIAYGSTSKRLQTGNVTTIKGEDIAKQPINNPLLALEGRVPGLFITQSSGIAGSGVTVRVQGQNSIGKNNDPLYLIDGVPYTSQLLPTVNGILGTSGANIGGSGSGNPLSFINPADIESIVVLKDADATSIYGSRAANGAILITTKKGRSGQTKVDINLQRGWGKVTRQLDVLNLKQFLTMRQEAKKNDNAPVLSTDWDINGFWDTTRSTDWQKELIGGTAQYTDVQSSVSGGNATTQFLVGAGYHKETTVFPGDLNDQKGSLHFNINSVSVNQKFRFQLTGNYLADVNKLQFSDLTNTAIRTAPNAPALFNPDGSLNWAMSSGVSTWTNPLSYIYIPYNNKTNNLVTNSVISYQFAKGLELKSSFGYSSLQNKEYQAGTILSRAPENRANTNRNASYANSAINGWIIEPQLSYKQVISKGKLEVLVGTTFQQTKSDRVQLSASGFNSDLVLEDIKSATTVTVSSTVNSLYKYNALFGRVNYNWKEKYIFSFNARRDGSSRFGSENLFHNFGSAAGVWILSKEDFFQKALPIVSFAKLRVSYGTTGNDQIGDYTFMNLYSPVSGVAVPYRGGTALSPSGLPNPYLQWEETQKLQVGFDLGLLNERILINANYFRNSSSNQLLFYPLPRTTGFANISSVNFPATVVNSGLELTISTTNIQKKSFHWTSNFNLTVPKNKLAAFPDLATSSYASTYIIGQPVSSTRLYHFLGVDPQTGFYVVADKNGNATSNPDFSSDRSVLVNTAPKFYGGIGNTFSYKGFELDVLFQFVNQLGSNYYFGAPYAGFYSVNQPTTVLNRWQKPGDLAATQRYNTDFRQGISSGYTAAIQSDAAYSDASYIRLKNLSLSWQLPAQWRKKAGVESCRVYVQGQNLLTFTKYPGLDPENRSSQSLPPLRVLTVGLQVTL